MSISLNQAIAALSNSQYQTLDGLKQLVAQISVEVPGSAVGATTLFYSGSIDNEIDGLMTWKIAENIGQSSNKQVITIGQTIIPEFFSHPDFLATLQRAANTTDSDEIKKLLDGITNLDGTRTPGMWDIASKNLAQAASGNVLTITPLAEQGKVFIQTELPALLDNPSVTHINGQPISVYKSIYEQGGKSSEALYDVAKSVNAASLDMLIASEMRIVKDATGKNLVGLDASKYLADLGVSSTPLPAGQGTSLAAEVIQSAQINGGAKWDLLKQGYQILSEVRDIPGASTLGTVAKRGLPFLGLAIASFSANAAYQQGDVAGAKRIMADAAADTLGSIAGEIAAGAVIGGALLALGVGAIPAGIIATVAVVAGGVIGGAAATRMLGYARQGLADLGLDLGADAPAPRVLSAQNPTTIDISVDTQNLKPDPTSGLGTSENGQGTLAAGAGYVVKANANYVNNDGLANTALSNIVTNGTRPGNKNLNPTENLMNSLRAQMNDVRAQLGATQMNGTLVAGAGIPVGTARSKVELVTQTKTGTTFMAEVYFAENGTMIGLTPQSNVGAGADQLTAGVRYVPSTTSGAEIGWSVGGLQPYNGAGVTLYRQTADTLPYTDPLSLDQGDDGIRFSPMPVSFDANGDGVSESLPWPISADPWLVLDANGDGAINNGSELIGLSDSTASQNLLRMDSNGDKVLNNADLLFAKLAIWGDRNLDGYAQNYERLSLANANIVSIDLDPAHIKTNVVAGQSGVKGVVATYTDGTKRTLWDLALNGSTSTSAATETTYRPGVDKLTTANGSVLVANAAQGVTLDLTGSGAGQAMGAAGKDTLTGTSGDDWLIGGAGADKFQAGAGNDLLVIDADDKQADINAGTGIDTALVADDRGVLLNLAQANVEVVYGGFGSDVFIGGGADNYVITAASGDDFVIGGTADDVLDGDDGDDVLDGGKGDDLIRGSRGLDLIYGGEGNDVLDGGLNDDTINGGIGNDVVIASGGRDMVDGGEGTDLLELQGALEDYKFQVSGTNSNGSHAWLITDSKNGDGSLVVSGEVSDRDGIQQIRNVEKFSFKTGSMTTTLGLGIAAPLPVNDRISSMGGGSISISAASLLANDLDFQSLGNPQLRIKSVSDAIGGDLGISADRSTITFTPFAGYSGPMSFTYTIQDKDFSPNDAPTIALIDDRSQQGVMKARVLLVQNDSDAPTDPEYAKQWYLGAIDAASAWKSGYTGKGVQVLVFEPGDNYAVREQVADLNSADLKPNQASYFVDTVEHSNHATAVAGVIAAARNGMGGVGVAYDATLNSVSFSGNTLLSYANKLALMRDYDIVNNSWGPADQWSANQSGPTGFTQQGIEANAIKKAATSGRNGLGTIMVFSAGNDRSKGFDSGLRILTANPYTINVAAINRVADVGAGSGVHKPFSERGANILVSAPGSGIQTASTMLQNNDGDVLGSATDETQGTSFAAPIVSGVVALMLQANDKLSYRDVQTILALTAKKSFGGNALDGSTWVSNKADDWNGSGMHFSSDYGFGMVDADAAVRMAESWISGRGYSTEALVNADAAAGALADMGTQTLTFNVVDQINVEQVILGLNLSHGRWSDFIVKLTSPKGTTSTLLDRPGYQDGEVYASNPAGEIAFDENLMSTHFRGETAVGTWTLSVQDAAAGGVGSGSITASLNVMGTDSGNWKHYTVTDEYGGGWTISPLTNQSTELNAAAMSKSVRLDLSGGVSNVNGKSINLGAGLDRLVGGQTNDTLLGASGDETLIGGAGNDDLSGGAGRDELQGSVGNDVVNGGAGSDLIVAGLGNDTLSGGADADIFLIEGNASSQTTVKDFNMADGGDVLRIRTQAALPYGGMTQNLANGKLTINAGGATVILEGVNSLLSKRQLIGMANAEALPVDSAGRYITDNTIYVEAVGEIKYVSPQDPVDFNVPSIYSGTHRGVNISYYGLSEESADHFMQNYGGFPSHNGRPESYTIENVRFRSGTEGADVLRSGRAMPPLPDGYVSPSFVSSVQQNWASDVNALGRPRFLGKGGDDEIIGSERDELLSGGADNDTLTGGKGNDYLSGGTGIDKFVFNVGDGNDTLTSGSDTIPERDLSKPTSDSALDASDVLMFHANASSFKANVEFSDVSTNGFTVNTVLSYGTGDSVSFGTVYTLDQLIANSDIHLFNAQFDVGAPIIGTAGGRTVSNVADVVDQVKYGSKIISSLGGNDLVYALKNNALNIDGGSGDDIILALAGNNTLQGSDGNDYIVVTPFDSLVNSDTLYGGKGNDTLEAGNWGALMYGDFSDATASDSLSSYDDDLYGGNGSDTIHGGYGGDRVNGFGGADSLYGNAGSDVLIGGSGDDKLYGGADRDILVGGNHHDELHGDEGDDVLNGDEGNDYLYGDAGEDMLTGGDGDDVLEGGADADYFDTGSGSDTLNVGLTSGADVVNNATGVDVARITGISSISGLQAALTNNGAAVEIFWSGGSLTSYNSLTYTNYNLDTQIWLDGGTKTTLRAVLASKRLTPDDTFAYLNQYDLQLEGNTSQVGTLIGDADDNELYGGPKGLAIENTALNGTRYGVDDASYWYVLGGAGEDKLASGKLGAFLDGGGGNDSIRASSGVVVLSDTFYGGNDTLVMPEGMLPSTLRFSRIANPLQEALLDQYSPMGSTPQMAVEQMLPTALMPNLNALPAGPQWNATRHEGNYNEFPLHYDTLRIQSVDGKYTADLLAYFENGGWESSIHKVLFTTELDADGKSKSYFLKDLVAAAGIKDASFNSNDKKAIIGGESGTKLYGQVDIWHFNKNSSYGYNDPNFYDYTYFAKHTPYTYGNNVRLINSSIYRNYISGASYYDNLFLSGQSNSGSDQKASYVMPGFYSTNDSTRAPFSIYAASRADYIMGFGGNDTIDAGGVYNEIHYSGQGDVATRQTYSYNNNSADTVNGGAGDDTYIYSYSGSGELLIIATDEQNVGAEGFDTLNLIWMSKENFNYGNIGADGSLYINSTITINNNNYERRISVAGGANGHLQVDRIVFSDGFIDVKDYLNTSRSLLSVDFRKYGIDQLGRARDNISIADDSRFWGIIDDLPNGAVHKGSPMMDVIRVPDNGMAYGAEGSDLYVIDKYTTDFAVVMMDKGDGYTVGSDWDWLVSYLVSDPLFAPIGTAGALYPTYLNKTTAQWIASGVLPIAGFNLNSWNFGGGDWHDAFGYGDYGTASIPDASFQYGKLMRKSSATSNFSLADWQAADGSFDDITDTLISWTTKDSAGTNKEHHVILVGEAKNQIGMENLLSQGDDYFTIKPYYYNSNYYPGSNFIHGYQYGPNDALDSRSAYETFALGGNDTVAAFAYDGFFGGAYHGPMNIIYGGGGNDLLDGGAGNDSLYGGADVDTLIGGFGNDYLDGGSGADSLVGGEDNDIYIVDGSDVVIEKVGFNNVYRPIYEKDVYPSYAKPSAAYVNGVKVSEMLTGAIDPVTFVDSVAHITNKEYKGYWKKLETVTRVGSDESATSLLPGPEFELQSSEYISLGWRKYIYSRLAVYEDKLMFEVTLEDSGQDEIRGDLDLDLRDGRYANVENVTALGTTAHYLTGNAGNNVLTSNGAGSTLQGLDGNDKYYVFSTEDKVVEAIDAGHDTLYTNTHIYQLANNIEDLYSAGAGLILTGNTLNNHIVGDQKDNLVDGGAGADTLEGGLGDDNYVVNTAEDQIIESAGAGKDAVWVGSNYTLGGASTYDIEYMRAGNDHGVYMKGNSLSKQVLVGAAGEDTLDGGGGMADSLYGGHGNDTFIINSTNDVVVEAYAAGIDSINIAYNNTSSAVINIKVGGDKYENVENASLIDAAGLFNLEGDGGNNHLVGNAVKNVISGGLGKDILEGGGGGDVYIAGQYMDDHGDIFYPSNTNDSLYLDNVDVIRESADSSGAEDTLIMAAHSPQSAQFLGEYSNNISLFRKMSSTGDDSLVMISSREMNADGYMPMEHYKTVVIEKYFNGDQYKVEKIEFADNAGEMKDLIDWLGYDYLGSDISDTMIVGEGGSHIGIYSGSGNDYVEGNSGVNIMYGEDGDDIMGGMSGDDELHGGNGNDEIWGGEGNDLLFGGAGNDYMGDESETSSESYIWGVNAGKDIVNDCGGVDILNISNSSNGNFVYGMEQKIWLRKIADNLEISIIGTEDSITVSNWYASNLNKIETISLGSHKSLNVNDVNTLVQAMSQMTPPPLGQTSLNSSQLSALGQTMQAAWAE